MPLNRQELRNVMPVDYADLVRELEDDKNDIKTNEKVFSEFVEDIENKISSEHKSWSLTTSSKNIH